MDCHSGTAVSTSGRINRSTISSSGRRGDHDVVESVQMINPATVLAVIEQTYLDAAGHPRDGNAGHTHLYVLTGERGDWQIAAGQNTVRS